MKEKFWQQLINYAIEMPHSEPKKINEYLCLPIASPIRAGILEADLQADGSKHKEKKSETKKKGSDLLLNAGMQRDIVSLRTHIHTICNRLCKHFKEFIECTDVEGVVENDLGLFDNNNYREYPTIEAFLNDIDCLHNNIKNSANGKSLKARQFINEACHLQETALAMVCQINLELAARCTQI